MAQSVRGRAVTQLIPMEISLSPTGLGELRLQRWRPEGADGWTTPNELLIFSELGDWLGLCLSIRFLRFLPKAGLAGGPMAHRVSICVDVWLAAVVGVQGGLATSCGVIRTVSPFATTPASVAAVAHPRNEGLLLFRGGQGAILHDDDAIRHIQDLVVVGDHDDRGLLFAGHLLHQIHHRAA
jgi:hypothetical protein